MRRVSVAFFRHVGLPFGLWLGLIGADVWSDAARVARSPSFAGFTAGFTGGFTAAGRTELKDAPELGTFGDEAPLVDPSRRLQIEELKSWPTILDARR